MARSFNGTSYLPSVDTAIAWGIGTGNFTMCCWVYSRDQSDANWHACMSFASTGANSPGIFTRSPTRTDWSVYFGSNEQFDTVMVDDQWYHLCARRTGTGSGQFHGFVDGVQEATTQQNSTSFIEASWVFGAGRPNGNYRLDGDVAEAALWDTDLTDDEIAALAQGFSPSMVRPDQLLAYAPLIRDEDRDLQDRAGGFTPTSSPTVADHPRIIYPPPKRIVYPVPSAAPADPAFNQYARKHTNVLLRR